jgi:hypothetical protein
MGYLEMLFLGYTCASRAFRLCDKSKNMPLSSRESFRYSRKGSKSSSELFNESQPKFTLFRFRGDSTHALTSVIFPYPSGADTKVSLWLNTSSRFSNI